MSGGGRAHRFYGIGDYGSAVLLASSHAFSEPARRQLVCGHKSHRSLDFSSKANTVRTCALTCSLKAHFRTVVFARLEKSSKEWDSPMQVSAGEMSTNTSVYLLAPPPLPDGSRARHLRRQTVMIYMARTIVPRYSCFVARAFITSRFLGKVMAPPCQRSAKRCKLLQPTKSSKERIFAHHNMSTKILRDSLGGGGGG